MNKKSTLKQQQLQQGQEQLQQQQEKIKYPDHNCNNKSMDNRQTKIAADKSNKGLISSTAFL